LRQIQATPTNPFLYKRYVRHIFYLLVFSAFVSISAFQIVVVIALCLTLYGHIAERKRPSGILLFPFSLYAFPTFISTALFNPSYFIKCLDQALFPFLYCMKDDINPDDGLLLRINRLLVWIGIFLIPVIAYKFLVLHRISLISGGPFEMGLFFTLFGIASLALYFFSGKKLYILLFAIFSSVVFFSTKRAPVTGFVISVIIFALLGRRFMNRRLIAAFAVGFILTFCITFAVLVKKDIRFQALSKVLFDGASLSDAHLETISSLRWGNFKGGLTVIRNDLLNLEIVHILIGHGIHPGANLNPKPFGTNYESVFIISEYIERGLLGLVGMLIIYSRYIKFLLGFGVNRKEDFLRLPLLIVPAALMTGAIFTFFWDARLPLYFLLFGLIEKLEARHRPQKDRFLT
jgi:hypothetical protein